MRTLNITANKQRGAAVLAVAMLLLFGSTIAVFYMNRGIIFEQKASANQMRSTSAQEVAEAGLEWATGMLNVSLDIQATNASNCTFLTTAANSSFRAKYVQTVSQSEITSATNVYPGCKILGTTLTCNCPNVPAPTSEAVASLGSNVAPSFTVSFADVPGDDQSVQLTSTGCTAQAGTCKPVTAGSAATTGASDATATISVILKMKTLLRSVPAAPVTCGTTCAFSGSFQVQNFDPATNGISVNSGAAATGTSGQISSIPGLPPQNSVVQGDASLLSVASNDPTCTQSAMFNTYFGTTLEAYRDSREPDAVQTVNCTSASDCGNQINALYPTYQRFYFPLGLELNNSAPFTALGTVAKPVTLVSPAAIHINGSFNIYGMVFSNDADNDDLGTGGSTIHGALVTCAGFTSNGNGTVAYDPAVLKNMQNNSAVMVRVPGSWRDF